jgi:hypothetical protein
VQLPPKATQSIHHSPKLFVVQQEGVHVIAVEWELSASQRHQAHLGRRTFEHWSTMPTGGQRVERPAKPRDNTRKATISYSQRKQSQRFEADRVTKLKVARVLVELARDQGNKIMLARKQLFAR